MEERKTLNRRDLLKALGLSGVAAASLTFTPRQKAQANESKGRQATASASCDAGSTAYLFLTVSEAAFLESAVDVLIPKDDLSPSASECGVVTFIDRQLAGSYGAGARTYMQGPWKEGTSTQGYQKPMTPSEIYRASIRDINSRCRKKYKKEFDQIGARRQERILRALDRGQFEVSGGLGKTFFNLLYNNTMEGFFADPIYGGNRNKASWKMIGFPGVLALYSQAIETHRGKKYEAPIMSIEDMV